MKANTLIFFRSYILFFVYYLLLKISFSERAISRNGAVIDGISVIETKAIIAAMKERKIKDNQEAKILQEESTAKEVVSCGHIITCRPSTVSGFKQREGEYLSVWFKKGKTRRGEVQRGSVLQLI